MFRKIKRKKVTFDDVYKILTEEYDFNHGLFLEYLTIASTIKNDPELRSSHLKKSTIYMERAHAILEVRAKLYQKLGIKPKESEAE